MVHGLTLEIVEVDPTMGESHIARNRRAILEALFKDGLLERNKQLSVPVVPLRIGLVTDTDSETPMDELAADAKEAAALIKSMQATLRDTKAELGKVFAEMDAADEG